MGVQVDRRTGWWVEHGRDGGLHHGTIDDEGMVTCDRCDTTFAPLPPPLVGGPLSAQVQPADPDHPCRPTR